MALILQSRAGAAVKQGYIRRPDLGAWINILPDGRPLNVIRLIDYFNLLYQEEPKDRVLLTIQRGSNEIDVNVRLGVYDYLKDLDMTMRILAEGTRVNLVILPGEITNIMIEDPASLAEWVKTVRNQKLSEYEDIYLGPV